MDWQADMVRVLECQAEVYEYLIGEREDAPIEEYQDCIGRINEYYTQTCRPTHDCPVFDPNPGFNLLKRIDEAISAHVSSSL